MKIPAYWAKATAEETDRHGQKVALFCWRSSDENPEAAHESALVAAQRILQNILDGERPDRYTYGPTPLREEVIERFSNTQGALAAAVTRNGYGAMVLNTVRMMFIDLDFQPASLGEHLKYYNFSYH